VYAKIAGIPFPFIGVDGTDACSKIFLPDGSKAGCPLKAGQDYVYKNAFKVLEMYPKVRIHVLKLYEDLSTTIPELPRCQRNNVTLIACLMLFGCHFQAVVNPVLSKTPFTKLLSKQG